MPIIGAIITPHPPLLIPEVGRGQEKVVSKTYEAMEAAARLTALWNPEVIIVSSPHTVMYRDYFHISPGSKASGDMSSFGASSVRIDVKYDTELRDEIIRCAAGAGLEAGTDGERNRSLDHGVLVPMYFLRKAGVTCPIVRIGLSGFPQLDHYRLGQCIARAVENLGRRAVYLASGDLSHKLKADGPYGFSPDGPVFDEEITAAMKSADFLKMLTIDPALCSRAAECGLRSFQIMAGALDGCAVEPHLLSHEGPFGVGYAIATFKVTSGDPSRCFYGPCKKALEARLEKQRAAEDAWVSLARQSLETYVRTRRTLSKLPDTLPKEMTDRAAGVFVSLHVNGELRGCIGTISPVEKCIADEIVRNAVSAGMQDPRFPPVRIDELSGLEYSVDVLGESEPVSSRSELDSKRYGVIVTRGSRRGLLLPDLDGVDSVQEQLDIACRKAGISPNEPYKIERFEVTRHSPDSTK